MRGKDMTVLIRSASFRTEVKDVVTLLGKSKTRGNAVWQRTFEGQRDHIHLIQVPDLIASSTSFPPHVPGR
jgi:hypothetical protein